MSDVEICNSYDLITDDLVKEALRNDIGKEAELQEWEVRDFTKKGDNYASFVTSIMVVYTKEEETFSKSYIVKLNPMRQASTFTDLMENLYPREVQVFSVALRGMNRELQKINLPPIKAPRFCAATSAKRRETLITEDLRVQNYIMYDRTKGMDITHALLVVEELGRFHASSLLYEDSLPNKSISDTLEDFEEFWLKLDSPSNNVFDQMMTGQYKNASQYLKNMPEYEKCIDWMDKNNTNIGRMFIEIVLPKGPFNVLTHGDCWTNNMLFRYDKKGNPVEIRFVDLQCSRKSSPACDLHYFFYTSVNGQIRNEYYKNLLITYYLSFLKVLLLAGREPPFTFQDFEEEMKRTKIFGLFSGMMVLPIVLAESDDEIMDFNNIDDKKFDNFLEEQNKKFSRIASRASAFKDRFLSMFDDMLEANIFDD